MKGGDQLLSVSFFICGPQFLDWRGAKGKKKGASKVWLDLTGTGRGSKQTLLLMVAVGFLWRFACTHPPHTAVMFTSSSPDDVTASALSPTASSALGKAGSHSSPLSVEVPCSFKVVLLDRAFSVTQICSYLVYGTTSFPQTHLISTCLCDRSCHPGLPGRTQGAEPTHSSCSWRVMMSRLHPAHLTPGP